MIRRWRRFGRHLLRNPFHTLPATRPAASIRSGLNRLGWHLLETGFLLADCLCLPDLLLLLNKIFKPNTRRLNERERALGYSIFGESIHYDLVWMDERAHIGCRQYRFAYVGFNAINCWGALSDAHFMHELVHVWQYQKLGSVYIPRALSAQWSAAGYNYGGITALQEAVETGADFSSFNFEQQAEIVADYFCLKNDIAPRWCAADSLFIPVFEAIIQTAITRKAIL